MMRRKAFSAVGVVAVLGASVLYGLATSATAQPYPPGVCEPPDSASFGGTFAVGSTFRLTLPPKCVWNPGTAVSVTVNGAPVGTKTASPAGTITVTITALSATELSIDDPSKVAGNCGANTIVGKGASSSTRSGVSTHTETFNVECPGAAAAKPAKGKVALTGANILRWSAIALSLILVGCLFVALDRRRHRSAG